MKQTAFFFSFFLSLTICYSQSQINSCGFVPDSNYVEPAYSFDPCFDVQTVMNNCTRIWVRINLHFFVDDDCGGSAHPNPTSYLAPKDSYAKGEQLVNELNDMMELMDTEDQLNQAYWGATDTDPRCTQIRYLLKGVYIHCNSAAKIFSYFSSFENSFSEKIDSEFNVWITDHPVDDVAGEANRLYNSVIVENLKPYTICHELGHRLGYWTHPFAESPTNFSSHLCDDTWAQPYWYWDHDCDNIIDDSDRKCWHSDTFFDIDQDEDLESACDLSLVCTKHPCCEWFRQDNNVMSYSSWSRNPEYAALTPCQIGLMINTMATSKCDYWEGNQNNPPPSAFISILPSDNTRQAYCSYCLRLEASVNDAYYKLDFYDGNSMFNSTGWLEGPAERYCIYTTQEKGGNYSWFGGFEEYHDYKAVLTVENEQGQQDTYELDFTTPASNCSLTSDITFNLAPNPVLNSMNITYDLTQSSDVKIFASHSITGKYTGFIENVKEKTAGTHSMTVDVSSWNTGINYVVFQVDDQVSSMLMLKL